MTLVLSASLSGNFAFMTSDKRVVRAKYKESALEAGEVVIDESVPKIVCDEKDTKTHRLTNSVLVGAGGTAELSIFLTNALKHAVKDGDDLSDCKEILETIIEEARAQDGPDFLRYLDIKEGVSVVLSGFYRDGCTGLVTFSGGKDAGVKEEKADEGYRYTLIAPAKEYLRRPDELFNIPQLNDSDLDELSPAERGSVVFQAIFDRLVLIHGVASYNHPIEISSDFDIHVITLEDGEFQYVTKEFDLSGMFTQYSKVDKEV